jgi:arylsulfatase A-like enzyme
VTDALAEYGHEEETLVILTTDHGIGFPRAMGTCYDPGVEIACIMRWPGRFDGGTAYTELLSNVDFTPTLLDIVGEPAPTSLDGRSFYPLLADEAYEPRDRVYLEFTWHSKYNPIRAVRTPDYKYILNIGDVPLVYIPAPLFSSAAGLEVRDEFYGEQRPKEELYDMREDPHEQRNVLDDPEYEETADELRTQVQSWMEETDDRLLKGDWPPTPKQEERVKRSPWIPREIDQFC